MKKYLVYGQSIPSKNDNDRHYISSRKVAELYKVNPNECIMIDGDRDSMPNRSKLRGLKENDLIVLKPDYDGDYSLEKVMQEYKERVK